jgi:polar amino acid transport system ATP-binding protein
MPTEFPTRPTDRSAGSGASPVIRASAISKSYGDHLVLDDISLDIGAGEVVAIIGPSGGGKSTFLRCLNYLEQPTAGTVEVLGRPIAANPPRATEAELMAVHRQVGMVFQNFNLFPHLSVLQNITLAQQLVNKRSKKQAEERALLLLDRVGLADKAGARPAQCSGGQQQRIAIARALALDPAVMLFDEPTSALDPEVGAEVLKVIKELAAEGMTMAIVTHEMGFARQVADTVLLLADGRILEQGAPDQVFGNPAHDRTRRFLDAVLDR